MSKRRSDYDETCLDSYRSSRSEKKASLRSVFNTVEESENLSVIAVCKVLATIDSLKGQSHDSIDRYRENACYLLQKFPENDCTPLLKYTNQMVEIPLFVDSELQLHYYEKFPFVREPMSISTSVEYFTENMLSFTHFKKIILKNARLRIAPDSLGMMFNSGKNRKEIVASCIIISPNGRNIQSVITEDVLSSANILFEQPHLWRISYEIIENDENLGQVEKNQLLGQVWWNLCRCFDLMDSIELGVTVDKEHRVRICNILHNYYTRWNTSIQDQVDIIKYKWITALLLVIKIKRTKKGQAKKRDE